MSFSRIVLIYNPKSTNGGAEKAVELQKLLQKRLRKTPIEAIATEAAGHAKELAQQYADPEMLLVSVSGDGGYNELINGVMELEPTRRPVCVVYPAGNANDHSRAIKRRRRSLVDSIVAGKTRSMDILTVTNARTVRYAHSYIGLGITPVVAVDLNRHTLNALTEAWIVLKSFWHYQPFEIEQEETRKAFNSLVFANINVMAKVVTLSEKGSPHDGKFEVIAIPSASKLHLIWMGLVAAFSSLKPQASVDEYAFSTLSAMPMQLDGEVFDIGARSKVVINIVPAAIRTLA